MTGPRLERRDALTPEETARVLELVAAATTADGAGSLSEAAQLRVRHRDHGAVSHLLLFTDDRIDGYAQLEPPGDPAGGSAPTVELVAAPSGADDYVRRLVAAAADSQPAGVRVWAHGAASPIARVAAELQLPVQRRLLLLQKDLDAPLPEPAWPGDVTVRSFVVGRDEAPWLDVNRRAFAGHPEQGSWTRADLEQREAEPWFDPAGFFVAERGDRMIGFHWTKVHPAHPRTAAPIGEVYVIGVDPDLHGEGLGVSLTLHGLRHLQREGLPQVMLYVDEDNASARRLYDRLGFVEWDADVCFLAHR